MESTQGYYKCTACGRSYKSEATPEKCAVCGAASGGREQPSSQSNADASTAKFRLAADRAKGNFR